MSLKFFAPDKTDSRIDYACSALETKGYTEVRNKKNADFILLGIRPDTHYIDMSLPIFAGAVSGVGIYDYTKEESFAQFNAYLTAEGALALAISSSEISLIDAEILIVGFGRIGKALLHLLTPLSRHITVCARRPEARTEALCLGAHTINFEALSTAHTAQFIFNTVCHPVFNAPELRALKSDALLMDLASFPGGIDKHYAQNAGIHYLSAGGLPARFSPQSAGEAVARTVSLMTKEVLI